LLEYGARHGVGPSLISANLVTRGRRSISRGMFYGVVYGKVTGCVAVSA
jgi:hypothetical protein